MCLCPFLKKDPLCPLCTQDEFGTEEALLGEATVGGGLRELRERWGQRWGVGLYKLEKGAEALSALDFVSAVFFLLSSRHDISAAYRIATLSATRMQTTLECFQVRGERCMRGKKGMRG